MGSLAPAGAMVFCCADPDAGASGNRRSPRCGGESVEPCKAQNEKTHRQPAEPGRLWHFTGALVRVWQRPRDYMILKGVRPA